MDDEFAKLIRRINPPRVVIDNDSCDDATIIKVDSVKKHETLLHVVQTLTDMNLVITKCYISSDAGWFMDVFNVVDGYGDKITDQDIISDIQMKLESNDESARSVKGMAGMVPFEEYTCIELTGPDRPGFLSEVCAILTDLRCNVVSAELWTHRARVAAVVYITDDSTSGAIGDAKRLATIKELLGNLLRANNDTQTSKLTLSPPGASHRERRLHQMFADHDCEKVTGLEEGVIEDKPLVTVSDCTEKDYTVITVRSKDRPKLLFDTLCTLTDMNYVVYHGVVHAGTLEAYQEFFVRRVDGVPVRSETERQRIARRLEAAIERRSSAAVNGLELELYADDRIGLLSNITRILRENSLYVRRAEISTKGGKARDVFYVTDVTGSQVDPGIVDSIRQQIGEDALHVRWNSGYSEKQLQENGIGFMLGTLFRTRTFPNFLIGSKS